MINRYWNNFCQGFADTYKQQIFIEDKY